LIADLLKTSRASFAEVETESAAITVRR
jgi:hypothetical protein